MSLKRFRVTKSDGSVEIIEANNMDDAISKAKHQFGKLPNDINAEIVEDVISNIKALMTNLGESITQVRASSKELDWEKVYVTVKQMCSSLQDDSDVINKLVGSMVKVDKNEDEI